LGKRIIQAKDTLHYKGSIGHVMRRPSDEFFVLAVDQERTNLQIQRRALVFAYHQLHRRPLAQGNHVLPGCG
jgi:hypothetical protein